MFNEFPQLLSLTKISAEKISDQIKEIRRTIVPAALLDYKFSLLHEKGELVNSMYIRKADFLKGDLHAYNNDIGYGDI